MPPKKKAAVSAKKETSDPIFGELVFCISRRASHKKTEIQQLIEQNGGKTSSTLSSATHLVIPDEDELEKRPPKICEAENLKILIITESDITEAVEKQKFSPELDRKREQASDAPPSKKQKTSQKKEDDDDNDDNEGEDTASKSNEIPSGPFPGVKGKPPAVLSEKINLHQEEKGFPGPIKIIRQSFLQATDLKNNHNKYYSLELQQSSQKDYRVYTHYGRTDDLETNSMAGVREIRMIETLEHGKQLYNKIFSEKTAGSKGYQPIKLAVTKIGSFSSQNVRQSIRDESRAKARSSSPSPSPTPTPTPTRERGEGESVTDKDEKEPSTLHPSVQELVSYIYQEATSGLKQQVKVEMTQDGIETPLGVLSMEQIEAGEEVLDKIFVEITQLKEKKKSSDKLITLSNDFYTKIPHQLGRREIQSSVINNVELLKQKRELLQLMKDMLNVIGGSSSGGNVFIAEEVDKKYQALGCKIELVDRQSEEGSQVLKYLSNSVEPHQGICKDDDDDEECDEDAMPYNVDNIFKIIRPGEIERFTTDIGNEHLLYHGSRVCNWMGLLSRGILMPDAITKLGVTRTDFGWLGAGIYFGDCFETSSQYCTPGAKGTSFLLLCNVALGQFHHQLKQNGSIRAPPPGFHSIHGDPNHPETEFSDHEFCIYNQNQQYAKYLIEWS